MAQAKFSHRAESTCKRNNCGLNSRLPATLMQWHLLFVTSSGLLGRALICYWRCRHGRTFALRHALSCHKLRPLLLCKLATISITCNTGAQLVMVSQNVQWPPYRHAFKLASILCKLTLFGLAQRTPPDPRKAHSQSNMPPVHW